jgi:gamma-glutamylcyclotransferase (GGCT)/AIG2-like uncharacterized protein YtfP
MPALLFAYGTLRKSEAPAEIAKIVATLERIGPAQLQGELYDLGEYPAALFTRPKSLIQASIIPGELFSIPNQSTLKSLDQYEDFNPNHPEASLFIRKQKFVTLISTGQRKLSWVYEFNQPLPSNARRIN